MNFFSHDEIKSACWMKLRDHLTHCTVVLRRKLENPSLGENETAVIRGEIRALRKILALEKKNPSQEPGSFPHYDT